MSQRFKREEMRKKIYKASKGGVKNTLGLFRYTPYSVGDDSLY